MHQALLPQTNSDEANMKHAAEVLAISILGTLFAWGAPASSWAQQIGGGSIPPVSIKLYTLDCGLTEFQGAGSDVFSDTGEYEGKSLELPTPCFLIQHGKDWLLWDTGLSDKLVRAEVEVSHRAD